MPDDSSDAVEDWLSDLLLHEDEGGDLLHDVPGVGGEDHHLLQQGDHLGPGQAALVVRQLELQREVVVALLGVEQADGGNYQVGWAGLGISGYQVTLQH